MLKLICLGFALTIGFLADGYAESAQNCGNGRILFEDSLQSPDISWQLVENSKYRTGSATGQTWTMEPDLWFVALNEIGYFEDFDLCVDVTATFPENADSYASLAFWGIDQKNYYVLSIYPAKGTFGVFRVQKNTGFNPVAIQLHPAIIKTAGATNHLRVTVKGNQAIFWANGEKLSEMRGIPPAGGGKVGFELGTSKTDQGTSEFTVANFQVRDLPNP